MLRGRDAVDAVITALRATLYESWQIRRRAGYRDFTIESGFPGGRAVIDRQTIQYS